jgi:hypothetical protein
VGERGRERDQGVLIRWSEDLFTKHVAKKGMQGVTKQFIPVVQGERVEGLVGRLSAASRSCTSPEYKTGTSPPADWVCRSRSEREGEKAGEAE